MTEYVLYKPAATQKTGALELAQRPASLNGKTVGLLFNAKVNADVYLQRIRELIAEKYQDVQFVHDSKPTASKPMEAHVFEKMNRCHVVVNAFGD